MTPASPTNLPETLRRKADRCRDILRSARRVVVALSGGVDSTLLLALAVEALGRENVLAATATGPIFPRDEVAAARQIAATLDNVELVEIATEMDDPRIVGNEPERCYWCKHLIFSRLLHVAESRGFFAVASGSNADDRGDYRPGARAEEELDILRPLRQAEMTKQDIRDLSRAMGLATWDKPSRACLASRVPYGRSLSDELLRRIEQAEKILMEMDFRQCRVRDHDTVARVEVPAEMIEQAVKYREKIAAALKKLGYTYVTLDMEGFRSGAMNETL